MSRVSTFDQAIAAVGELGFPRVFIDILRGAGPRQLDLRRPTVYFRILGTLLQLEHRVQDLLPLWEVDGRYVMVLDRRDSCYYRLSYDRSGFEFAGDSYQRFIAVLFFELRESLDDEELEDIASLFRFNFLDDLLVYTETGSGAIFEDGVTFAKSLPPG